MTTEEIRCTSLELSKQLKEAGYKQEGLWWWRKDSLSDLWFLESEKGLNEYIDRHTSQDLNMRVEYIVAPTVAELGEVLSNYGDRAFATWKAGDGWYCFDINERDFKQRAIAEADCRVKMWLYLKKEGLL